MRKIFLTLVLVTTAACSGGGSNSPSAKGDPISADPAGNLKVESDSGDSTGFGNNCQTDKLDPKIKVGITQGILFNIFAQDIGALNVNGTYSVKSVDPVAKTFVTVMSFGNSSEEQTCGLTSEGTLCEGSTPTPSKSAVGGDQSCEVHNGSSGSIANAHGTLTLKNDGQTVSVKESKMSNTGNLFCNGKDTGKTATQKTTLIMSPEIPALTSARGLGCGGLVFMYQQIIDSSGVVRSTSKMEIVSQSN